MADNVRLEKLAELVSLPRDGKCSFYSIGRFSIFSLFFFSGPLYISRNIVPIIINSIYSMTHRRALSDIRNKGFEGVNPFRVYGNAASAVSVVGGGFWVAASSFHTSPASVCWCRLLPLPSGTMLFNATTPTFSRFTRCEVGSINVASIATGALAFPANFFTFSLASVKNSEIAKSFADKVKFIVSSHNYIIPLVREDRG